MGTDIVLGETEITERQASEEQPIVWEDVELHERPEDGYHNYIPGFVYICWKDILVLGNDIYRKRNGVYRRTGETVSALLGEGCAFGIRQYHNLMIVSMSDWKGFILFDLDTWERSEYRLPEGEELDYTHWFIYEGKIYYQKDGVYDSLCAWSIEEQTEEELYVRHDVGENRTMGKFMIRDDGTIILTILEFAARLDYPEYNYISKWEFWKLSRENQQMIGTKIWETSEIEDVYWIDFNKAGLVFYADNYDLSTSSFICLTEDGDVINLWVDMEEWPYVVEDGFYAWDYTSECGDLEGVEQYKDPKPLETVSKYDFEGCKVATYRLMDEELREEGYSIAAILYQYQGDEITVYLENEDTDRLYIRQIQTD